MTPKEQARKQYNVGLARIPGINTVQGVDNTADSHTVTANPYSTFVSSLQKPMTPEEEAKRERAARAVQGVAGLGNLMSAFANLTYTGSGAPSQTLPTQQVENIGNGITTWKDKLQSERDKYAAAELDARAREYQLEYQRQKDAQTQANADRAYRLQLSEIARAQGNADRAYEYQKGRNAEQLEYQRRKDAQTQANWEATNEQTNRRIAVAERNAETQAKRAEAQANGGSSSSDWKPVSTHLGDMEIDYKALNGFNLAQYAEMLAKDGKDDLAEKLAEFDGSDTKSVESLRQEIGKALTNPANAAVVEDMIRRGILRKKGVTTATTEAGGVDLSGLGIENEDTDW